MNRRQMLSATAGVAVAALIPQVAHANKIVDDGRITINMMHVRSMTEMFTSNRKPITQIAFLGGVFHPFYVVEGIWEIYHKVLICWKEQNYEAVFNWQFKHPLFVRLQQCLDSEKVDLDANFNKDNMPIFGFTLK